MRRDGVGESKRGRGRATLSQRAEVRLAVVRAWQAWRAATGLSGLGGANRFAADWKRGAIETQPCVREMLAGFCGQSVIAWEKRMLTRGASALGGDYRGDVHKITRDPKLLARAEAAMAKGPTTASRLRLALIVEFGAEAVPSVRAVNRWIAAWKAARTPATETAAKRAAALMALDEWDRLSLVITSAVNRADPAHLAAVTAAVRQTRAAIAAAEGGA